EVLQPFGGLIAIGRPGESLPTPGAARIYTSDEEWKDVVKRQIQAAQLVVIRAAAGENVLWELTQALKFLNPQKLLILLLNMKVRDYESFRTRANSILDVPLPESTRLRRYGASRDSLVLPRAGNRVFSRLGPHFSEVVLSNGAASTRSSPFSKALGWNGGFRRSWHMSC